jgi:transcriptional regulator with XRE-family HTH domain
MSFAENLKKLRKRANLSQFELAQQLGVNQYNISFWEIGRSEPNIEQIIKIAEILNVPTDYLLGRDVILTSSTEEFQIVENHFIKDIEDEMLAELISLYSSIPNEKKKDLLQLVKSLTNLSK